VQKNEKVFWCSLTFSLTFELDSLVEKDATMKLILTGRFFRLLLPKKQAEKQAGQSQ
jgi:hypothetical protein